jgi:dipeptidyl aminopeptidase/acylaminoacyl peptidase
MRRLVSLFSFTLLLGCAAASENSASAAPKVARTAELTPEALVGLSSVWDAQISPDGKLIAYTIATPRKLDDPGRSLSSIWIVPRRGGEPRRFSTTDVSSYRPHWSPDGKTLAFISTRKTHDDHAQVLLAPIGGGEAAPLTTSKTGVSDFAWSPDGKHIAYLANAPQSDEEKKEEDAGRDWDVDEVVGHNNQLFLVEVETGKTIEITDGKKSVHAFEWAPNGKMLAIQASDLPTVDHSYMYRSIYTVKPEGGELHKLTDTAGKLGDMEFSPDGTKLAFLGAADINDSMPGSLWVVPSTGGTATNLTGAFEGTAIWVGWLDARTVVFAAHESTDTTIRTIAAVGGKAPAKLMAKNPTCRSFDTAKDRRSFACAGSRPTHPGEVFAGSFSNRKIARLTTSNPELEATKLGEQEVVAWTAKDGTKLEGVLIKPVGYEKGKRYPLAVLPHGGPEGVSLDGWNTRANYPAQLFASHGYVVFEPNYRGSSGRGHAFETADHQDLGGAEFEDVLAGIDHLVDQGLVDGDRVGMGGWSYGGYFSGLAATKWSDRFKATMIAAAITNWMSFTGTTEIEHENSLVHWKLWPYEKPELVWDRSPMAHTQGAKTPALIIHGSADSRVPPSQSTELFRALKHAGVETQLVMYPREGHGLGENVHQLDFVNRWMGWFDQHVKNAKTGG